MVTESSTSHRTYVCLLGDAADELREHDATDGHPAIVAAGDCVMFRSDVGTARMRTPATSGG